MMRGHPTSCPHPKVEWQDAGGEREGGRHLASSFGDYIDSNVFNQNVGYKGEECLSSHLDLLSFHDV